MPTDRKITETHDWTGGHIGLHFLECFTKGFCKLVIYRVIQDERSIFLEVTVTVTVKKKSLM